MKIKFNFLIIILISLAFVFALIYIGNSTSSDVKVYPSASPTSKPEGNSTTSEEASGTFPAPPPGWELYSDKKLGVRINYPQAFGAEKNGDYSVTFIPKRYNNGQGSTIYFYISVISKSQTYEVGEIYNYRPEDLVRLQSTSVGETISLTENPSLNEWFHYERLEDRSIAGINAIQFVNQKPWEFPNGTKEVLYVLVTKNKTYLLGAYFQPTNDTLTKEMLEQAFGSFGVLSDNQSSE